MFQPDHMFFICLFHMSQYLQCSQKNEKKKEKLYKVFVFVKLPTSH